MRRILVALTLLIATLPAAVMAATAFVTNEKDDSLSIIDTGKMAVVKTVKIGRQPRGILLSADKSKLYICASADDTIQVFDIASQRVVQDLPSGEDPETFALTPDGKFIYVSNENSNTVSVIDIDRKLVVAQFEVGVEPEGMAVSPDGKLAVNTSETTSMVHWIATDSHTIIDNTQVDQRPRVAVFSPDGKRLWVSSEIGGTVSVIDVASRKIIHTITFAIKGIPKDKIEPVGIRLSSNGKVAFVALGPANHVAMVDPESFAVKSYILVGQRVWQMAFSPDESQLYTTNGISGDVTVIDVARGTALKSIRVGRYPWGVVIRP